VNKLNAMMDEPTEEFTAPVSAPVPAKRDEQVYRERALKLVREVLNI